MRHLFSRFFNNRHPDKKALDAEHFDVRLDEPLSAPLFRPKQPKGAAENSLLDARRNARLCSSTCAGNHER
jgi:hypothetical protein